MNTFENNKLTKYIKKLESLKKFEKKISPDAKFFLDHVTQPFYYYDGRFPNDEELLKRLGQMTIQIGKLKYKLDQHIWQHRAKKEDSVVLNLWLQLRKYNGKYNQNPNREYVNIYIILLTKSSFKKYVKENYHYSYLSDFPDRQIILFAKDFKFKSNFKLRKEKHDRT